MTLHNPHRGEYALILQQQNHILRLSLQALAQIEQALQMPITELAQKAVQGQLNAQQLIVILTAAWQAGSHAQASLNDIAQSEMTYAEASTAVVGLFERAFTV